MAKLRDLLDNNQAAEEHPKLRHWRHLMAQHRTVTPRVQLYRPRDLLGFKAAKIYFYLYDAQNNPILSDQDDWDPDLNEGLVKAGVRAVAAENEADRFSLALAAALSKAEGLYGDGYYNSVLVEMVKEIDFSDAPAMLEVLSYVSALQPNRTSRSYDECKAMIAGAARGRLAELRQDLKYSEEEATQIFSSALAKYLDERFSVTNRRKLGLLQE
jgi:hypothetical protein